MTNVPDSPGPFNEWQWNELNKPLDLKRIKVFTQGPARGSKYLEGFDVAEKANELFGFGNWGFELVGQPWAERGEDKNGNPYTVWLAVGRVKVKGAETYSDLGSNQQSGLGAPAVEMAIKGAVTDAMKRCLRLYGNQFGLSLYDKTPDHDDAPQTAQNRPAATQRPAADPAAMPGLSTTGSDPDEWERLQELMGDNQITPTEIAIIMKKTFTPANVQAWMTGNGVSAEDLAARVLEARKR